MRFLAKSIEAEELNYSNESKIFLFHKFWDNQFQTYQAMFFPTFILLREFCLNNAEYWNFFNRINRQDKY